MDLMTAQTNDNFCGATSVTSFTSADFSTLTTTEAVRLQTNPTLRDEDGGSFDPILVTDALSMASDT